MVSLSLLLLHTLMVVLVVCEGGGDGMCVLEEDDNMAETLGSCRKSLKSVDSVRKGLSRGSLKPLESVHSRGEAEVMRAEMTSSQMAAFP